MTSPDRRARPALRRAFRQLSMSRFVTPLGVAVAFAATGLATSAWGVPVATGTFQVSINTTSPALPMTGSIDFADVDFVVPGSLAPGGVVNLYTLVGAMNVTGNTTPGVGLPGETGAVVGSEAAQGNPALLSFDIDGEFICPGPTGCTGASFGAAFINDALNLAGTLVANGTLPADGPDVAYIQDGDASCTSIFSGGFLVQILCTGSFGLNVFFAENTPAGTDVTVSTSTSFFNPITGSEVPVEVDVNFAEVPPGGGSTIVTTTSSAAGVISSEFAVQVGGFSVAFFDVTTDFTPTGPIGICGSYPDENADGIVDGTDAGGGGISECQMRLLHDEGGTFVDRTAASASAACRPPIAGASLCPGLPSLCIDRVNNRVCAEVAELSLFGVFPLVAPEPIAVAIDVRPLSHRNRIGAEGHLPVPVAVLGAADVDVDEIDVTSLAFGPPGGPGAAPAFDLTDPFVLFLSRFDVNRDGFVDLVPSFVPRDTGLEVGDTEACLTGTIGGLPFEGCDDVVVVARGCGLGFELALILPPLLWARRRRATPRSASRTGS